MAAIRSLTIVSFAGDFREADRRLSAGGPETYRGQRYTQEVLSAIPARVGTMTYITGQTEQAYDERLASGVRAIGAGFRDDFNHRAMVRLVERTAPDALILRTPSRPVMRWARRNGVRTMLLIADSFAGSSPKAWLARRMLGGLLRADNFDVVANHGSRAAQQLVAFGVPAEKVLAWDYPAFDSPHGHAAKLAPGVPLKLFYAGMLIPAKGAFDLVHAVALLRGRGLAVSLAMAGRGEDEALRAEIGRLGVGDSVTLLGTLPNHAMIGAMAAADVVVVPSRHDYPEGLPLTIYEALCSRSPLVVSDHPMFVGNVADGESAIMFPAGNVEALADAIARLAGDLSLYARLSANAGAAWEALQIDVKWGQLIDAWLLNGDGERAWFRSNSLGA